MIYRVACLTLALAVLLFMPLAALHAADFHIAPNGNDAQSGSKDQPFATLERARDAVRQLKASSKYPTDGVTVWVHGGVYFRERSFDLNEYDSGQPGALVVYAAAPGETPRLVGGKSVPASAFKPVTDPAFLSRIVNHSARRHLLQADLKALGITEYGELRPMHALDFGSSSHYLPAPMELFIDGKAMTLARWPNRNEKSPFLGVVEAATQLVVKNKKGKPREYSTISFKDVPIKPWGFGNQGDVPALFPQQALEHVTQWGSLDDAYIGGGLIRAYAYTSRKIGSVDVKKGTLTFATPIKGLWDTYEDVAGLFYFYNLPDEIDVPGEYYLDRKSGVLTLYPPVGWNGKSEVILSTLNDVLVAMENTSHVRLRGLTLEATRTSGVYIERGENNVLEKCVIRNTGVVGVQIGLGWDTGLQDKSTSGTYPPEVKAAGPGKPLPRLPGSYRHVLCTGMESLPVRMPGATAWDRQGGKRNGVDGCTIYDTGCGGVLLGGGDRKTLTPAENFVRNSNIHHTDRRIHMYSEAVVVDGCGNFVESNYLHDNLGGLLYFLGNDHLMQYNEITRGLTASKDGGVVETRQNPSMLGNRLRFNYMHDNERGSIDHNAQNCTVYLDNSTHGVEIFGNVFLRNIGRTVKGWVRGQICVTEGHNHVISNNIFIDNPGVNIGDGCDYKKALATYVSGVKMLKQDVDVTQPPYSTRYPEFCKTYTAVAVDKETSAPLYNKVFNNALIGNNEGVTPGHYPDNNEYRHHNVEIDTDPGFVDEVSGNFALRPDSLVFKEIPGFEPIPFDKMQQAKKWEAVDQRQIP